MKHLAIDYGSKKNGLAVSNEKGTIAFPYGVINSDKQVFSSLLKIIQKEGIKKIVVGIPQYNTETPLYKQIKEFVAFLKQNTAVPVETQDELLTSEVGRKKMSRSNGAHDTHALAAQVILESYLKAF